MVLITVQICWLILFQPPRQPYHHGLHHPLSPTGSTPNLTALGPNSPPHHWSTTHLLTGPSPVPPSRPPRQPPGEYASHPAAPPPLGYIVAYTQEQIAELMLDQVSPRVRACQSGGFEPQRQVWIFFPK